MLTIVIPAAAVGLLAFLMMPLRAQALIAFLLMTQLLDVAPSVLFGMYVWDYGAVLMLIVGIRVYFMKPMVTPRAHGYMIVLRLLICWVVVCFLWSLLVNGYPLDHTIKAARRLLVGYPMALIFARLFCVDPDSFDYLLKWLYRFTLVLMPVALLQYVVQRPLLFGLFRDYEGSLRSLPVFLPLCLLNGWIISAKLLSGARTSWHEMCYLLLAMASVVLSFTRGIYLAVLLAGALLLFLMSRERQLRPGAILRLSLAAFPVLALLLFTGMGQRVGERTLSALHLVGGDTAAVTSKDLDDSYHGRLDLAGERFQLAFHRNPLMGFGFIHEDDVPPELRSQLRYGSVLSGGAANPDAYANLYATSDRYLLAFYSADIAWADIAITTGTVGIALLVALLLALAADYWRHPNDSHPLGYPVRIGLFLQTLVMFILMFDGDNFFGTVHIPLFLLAGYSLVGIRTQRDEAPALPAFKPANLLT